ncbi:MAG: glycosyltransferase family 39 protein [Acidobacteria bacterium]|nr:glycosyltransferase family 39 protein [Acidobacteriota bacterium]
MSDPRPGLRLSGAPYALVLLLGVLMAGALWKTGRIPWNGDQAVVSLMAQDVLAGERPVFMNGIEYAGTFEVYWTSVFFQVLGETRLANRAGLAVLLLLTLLVVVRMTDIGFGSRAALGAAVVVGLGPPFLFYKALSSVCVYGPLLLFMAATLAALVLFESEARKGGRVLPALLLLGVASGLGWWTHPLWIAVGPGALALLAFPHVRRALSPGRVALLGLAFLAGSFPWWLRNVFVTKFASLRTEEGSAAGAMPLETLKALVSHGLPVMLGGRSLWKFEEAFPGAVIVSWLLFAGLLVYGLRLASRKGEPASPAGLVLVLTSLTVPLLSLAMKRTDYLGDDPRYLLALAITLPPLAGALLASPRAGWLPKGALALALVALWGKGFADAPDMRGEPWSRPPTPSDDAIAELSQRGITALYGNYHTAYKTTFLSKGKIVGTPLYPISHFTKHLSITRRPWDAGTVRNRAMELPAQVGFLLERDDALAFREFLAFWAVPHREEPLGIQSLFREVDPEAVRAVATCSCIPLGLPRGSAAVLSAEGPAELALGVPVPYRVTVTNPSRRPFDEGVRVAWRLVGPAGGWGQEGTHVPLGAPLLPGETRTLEVPVVPAAEGPAKLVFDAVEENITWFWMRGSPPVERPVRVGPPPHPPKPAL